MQVGACLLYGMPCNAADIQTLKDAEWARSEWPSNLRLSCLQVSMHHSQGTILAQMMLNTTSTIWECWQLRWDPCSYGGVWHGILHAIVKSGLHHWTERSSV